MQNHYDILGVNSSSSQEEIKMAYRKLALLYHPDKTGGDKIYDEMFKRITAAYNVLSDPADRRKYDLKFFYAYQQTTNASAGNTGSKTQQRSRSTYKAPSAPKYSKKDEKRALRFVLGFFAGIIVLAVALYVSMNHYAAQKYFEEGVQYEKDQAYERAIDRYFHVLQVDPHHAEANEKLGDLRIALFGDYKGAISFYKKSLKEGAENQAELLYKKGKAYLAVEELDSAVTYLTLAVQSNSKLDTAWFILGEIYSLKANYADALSSYSAAFDRNPEFFEAGYGKSIAYFQLAQYGKSVQILDTLLVKRDQSAELFLLRGRGRLGLLDSIGACSDFMRADLFGLEKGRILAHKVCGNSFAGK